VVMRVILRGKLRIREKKKESHSLFIRLRDGKNTLSTHINMGKEFVHQEEQRKGNSKVDEKERD